MIKYIFNHTGDELIKSIDDTPICGIDFCDRCGDCLHCYQGQPCIDGKDHYWVEYED